MLLTNISLIELYSFLYCYFLTSLQCDRSFLYYLLRNTFQFVSHLFQVNWFWNEWINFITNLIEKHEVLSSYSSVVWRSYWWNSKYLFSPRSPRKGWLSINCEFPLPSTLETDVSNDAFCLLWQLSDFIFTSIYLTKEGSDCKAIMCIIENWWK